MPSRHHENTTKVVERKSKDLILLPKIWRRGRYWKYLKYRNRRCNHWKKTNLTLFVHQMSFSERLLIIERFDVNEETVINILCKILFFFSLNCF